MESKFRTKKGKPNVRKRMGFDFFRDWVGEWAYKGLVLNKIIERRIKQEKLAAAPAMKEAAAAKRHRRQERNLKLLAFSPNYESKNG